MALIPFKRTPVLFT
ncbi:putative LacI-family transcriptional regulator, partial [Salmonella enterica subsp. enterica serovar Typhimurium str. DT2]